MPLDPYRALPKTDLHCHLDGSLRWETVRELAPAAGVRLPEGAPESLRARGERSLDSVLEMFRYLVPLLRRRENVARAAYELAEDCARDGICYVEARYAPALCVARGFSADDSVEAVLEGLERGRKEFGVESRVVLCLLRGQDRKESRETLTIAKRRAGKGVAGLDLAGTESLPTRDYAPYFEEAAAAGLELTCHAGETGAPEHLESALAFGVSRIGHGTLLAREPRHLEQVRRRGILIEACLSSNVGTGACAALSEHPYRDFLKAGARVSLSTDDRGVFGISLSGEYAAAARSGAALGELAALAENGARGAFLPPAGRRALAARIRRAWRQGAPVRGRVADRKQREASHV